MTRLFQAFPSDYIRDQIYIQGGAFRKKHQFATEGEKSRFFFILNLEPKEDDELIIVTTTTKIEGRRKYRRTEVLVDLSPDDYEPLEVNSIIDCESASDSWEKSVLDNAIDRGKVEALRPIPQVILDRLCKAIASAKTLTVAQKRLILGDDAE